MTSSSLTCGKLLYKLAYCIKGILLVPAGKRLHRHNHVPSTPPHARPHRHGTDESLGSARVHRMQCGDHRGPCRQAVIDHDDDPSGSVDGRTRWCIPCAAFTNNFQLRCNLRLRCNASTRRPRWRSPRCRSTRFRRRHRSRIPDCPVPAACASILTSSSPFNRAALAMIFAIGTAPRGIATTSGSWPRYRAKALASKSAASLRSR